MVGLAQPVGGVLEEQDVAVLHQVPVGQGRGLASGRLGALEDLTQLGGEPRFLDQGGGGEPLGLGEGSQGGFRGLATHARVLSVPDPRAGDRLAGAVSEVGVGGCRPERPGSAADGERTLRSDLNTTMIYTHVLNRGGFGVASPADHL